MTRWWTDERINELRLLLSRGWTYDQCADHFGKSRGGVASAVWHYIKGKPWHHGGSVYVRKGTCNRIDTWSEHTLTETWAERKARLNRRVAA